MAAYAHGVVKEFCAVRSGLTVTGKSQHGLGRSRSLFLRAFLSAGTGLAIFGRF
jgi:hypothetical protein